VDVVRGYLQTYDWGPTDGLARWTGATGGPRAELWFGSHPNGRSPLRADPAAAARAQVPILAKILAAARPLSIQIHPPADIARAQYDRQRADPGVPALLADPNAKAEILIALEPFVILEGFRDPGRSAEIFSHLGAGMQPATQALAAGDLRRCVRWLLTQPVAELTAAAERLPQGFGAAGLGQHDTAVIRAVIECFPGDPGVFVAALLNARTLQPGQAVYVEPGTVHAYVRGTGVEVMTNSDNVLRLGLTTKTIAVDAALAAVDVGAQPHPCDPPDVAGIRSYAPPGAPFQVDMITDAHTTAATGRARVVVCLDGRAEAGGTALAPGDGVLLVAGDPDVTVRVEGRALVARQASDQYDRMAR
jgi:mannose-6-phosphate isomerase